MPSSAGYFPQIDTLRAVAVLAVIAGHFFPDAVPSGWLGVDVFFVISGFVITKALADYPPLPPGIMLARFYANRLRRLLPALLFVVAGTTFLFTMLVTRPDRESVLTGLWGVFGLANVALFRYAQDYFALDAQLNPFTHLWSLGVEEQFYLVFPLTLMLLGYLPASRASAVLRRRSVAVFAAVIVLSLAATAAWEGRSQTATFYLPWFRAWELSIGVLAFLLRERLAPRIHGVALDAALAALIALMLLEPERVTAIVLATALSAYLTVGMSQDLPRPVFDTRVGQYVGRLSYSLYLWHWPLLVLPGWTIGENLVTKSIALVAVALVSMLSYHGIERPLRYGTRRFADGRVIALAVLVASVTAVVAYQGFRVFRSSDNDRVARWLGVVPLAESAAGLDCHGRERLSKLADPLVHCLGAATREPAVRRVYLTGDSHAAQWVSAFGRALAGTGYELRFISSEENSEPPRVLLRGEVAQSGVLAHIERGLAPGDVLAIAFHRGRLNERRDHHLPLGRSVAANEAERTLSRNLADLGARVHGRGARLLLIHDTPLLARVTTVPSCATQLKLFGRSSCAVTREQDLHTRTRQDRAFAAAARQLGGVLDWDPAATIYASGATFDAVDDTGRYRMSDWNHLARSYAEQFAPQIRTLILGTDRARSSAASAAPGRITVKR